MDQNQKVPKNLLELVRDTLYTRAISQYSFLIVHHLIYKHQRSYSICKTDGCAYEVHLAKLAQSPL